MKPSKQLFRGPVQRGVDGQDIAAERHLTTIGRLKIASAERRASHLPRAQSSQADVTRAAGLAKRAERVPKAR